MKNAPGESCTESDLGRFVVGPAGLEPATRGLKGAEVVSAGGGVFLRRTGLEVDLTFAGVKLPRKSWANILPGPFWPGMPFEYGSVSADGAARDASVSRAGTVALEVNEGETVRGTMRWKVAAYSAFPLPPFPGLFHSL